MKINILTSGFSCQNSTAFLYPILKYKKLLRDAGYYINIEGNNRENISESDILILDSFCFRDDWSNKSVQIIKKVEKLRELTGKIYYFDVTASSNTPHYTILPYVDIYLKKQLLYDKACYLKPMYGHRVFSDYYHKKFQVVDKTDLYSSPIKDSSLLGKLNVGWNSGLAHYGYTGIYRTQLYKYLPIAPLFFRWKNTC